MSSPEMCWPVPMRAIGAQNLLTMPGGVSNAGYLHKKGGSQFSLMKWPLRYTIIHKGCVYYFKSSTSPAPQGAFSLNGYNRVMRAAEETTSSNVFPFKIVHFSKKHRTWYFSAASEDERRKWMRYLRREIAHYNDRKECQFSSDSDSDADSFYGTIERPLEIKQHVDNTDDDYVEDDEDEEDEEDYLKPDSDCSPTSTGRPTGPPPSYPPPPVPAAFQHRPDPSPSFIIGAAPPPVPPLHRIPTSPFPKKTPPSIPPPSILKDSIKGSPPPLPFAPHLQKTISSSPPPPPPPNAKRTLQSRTTSVGGVDKRDWKPLPVVENGPIHCSPSTVGSQSQGSNHHGVPLNLRGKPSLPPPPVTKPGMSSLRPVTPESLTPSSSPQLSPLLKSGLHTKPMIPKPPPPTAKPPIPSSKSKPGTPLQRASPDGQSFRSLGEETATEVRKKHDLFKSSKGEDSDSDYEHVQLPDSVFINSTETSFAEKLFKEGPVPPRDGLYCIRNSGTKTTKVLVVWDSGIGKARNYRLFQEGGLVFMDNEVTFPNLSALIEHYYSHPLPHHGSLCLQTPYTGTQST
ncbi:SH3 domain-binding protein 2 isoform X2 [Halichoeres trimaculatus]